mmetsp:Transcript_151856/g.276319  ORF Transcript_151856/g.276319 Transcript_151856/m.276319 type:complete len:287 (-) Transcript_151856:206-1066(-)
MTATGLSPLPSPTMVKGHPPSAPQRRRRLHQHWAKTSQLIWQLVEDSLCCSAQARMMQRVSSLGRRLQRRRRSAFLYLPSRLFPWVPSWPALQLMLLQTLYELLWLLLRAAVPRPSEGPPDLHTRKPGSAGPLQLLQPLVAQQWQRKPPFLQGTGCNPRQTSSFRSWSRCCGSYALVPHAATPQCRLQWLAAPFFEGQQWHVGKLNCQHWQWQDLRARLFCCRQHCLRSRAAKLCQQRLDCLRWTTEPLRLISMDCSRTQKLHGLSAAQFPSSSLCPAADLFAACL